MVVTYRFKRGVVMFLCEILHLTVLAVTIRSGEGYKVTCPKITVNCKPGVSQH